MIKYRTGENELLNLVSKAFHRSAPISWFVLGKGDILKVSTSSLSAPTNPDLG